MRLKAGMVLEGAGLMKPLPKEAKDLEGLELPDPNQWHDHRGIRNALLRELAVC